MHEENSLEASPAWALNRYYYQSRIPIKDAAILARSKILPSALHGGSAFSITMETGSSRAESKWLRLVEATGLLDQTLQCEGILPGTRSRSGLRRLCFHALASRSRRLFLTELFQAHHAAHGSPAPAIPGSRADSTIPLDA
jgi:pyrroloquinoline quinone (PQQ) biosynthesis protein C